ncbi:SpoIID/LytB domain-containing protein [Clostridium psychrophilum]|uniref:SpoIID/LytB domain-containing protein n=1 Tax=Clostridium psychrophilum TaxID=132926 RepID=UPI001C0B515C|nr:SpoIID/LytB domain-containing protein [Clostridium psychrophilum]MBU3180995.1 SpoIID/LytB domain-containing protein [Clostridium psychrophilum]
MKNKFRIFTVALFACIFMLGNGAYAFTGSNYVNSQNISVGLESMGCAQLTITLNGDYTLNGNVKKSGTSYLLKVSGSQVSFNGVLYSNLSLIPVISTNTIKITSIYTRNYRGTLNFKISSGKVLPVNTLYIEDYLKGVVGKEMSDYFPIEALKAQAVAARNYALANVSKHTSARGYSICDTTDCQVYGGYDSSLKNVIAAVDATKGKVLLSGTNIVDAFYSAYDGGYTEASENVWGSALSYLKTKQDIYDVDYGWNSMYTSITMNTLLKIKTTLKIPVNYTFVKIDLNSITKFTSGRIKNITIVFKDQYGTLYYRSYGKDSARTFLGLESALYNVTYDAVTDIYTFNGKGNGHGVGMSQIGAKHRASAGQSFETILKFYYDGTTIINAASDYAVSFDSQGGNAVSSKIVSYNSVIATPVAPAKTGYTFGGWYKESKGANAWNFTNNSVTSNTILYAKWTANKYTVSFNSQGGKAVSSKIVSYNSVIATPVAPTKTGYTFAGWYKQVGCSTAWNFATDKVAANTTLYAKWTMNKCTVTFNSQGGKAVSSKIVNYNGLITTPVAPTKAGYTFAGWYKQTGCLSVWNFKADKVTTNTILYAKWNVDVSIGAPKGLKVSSYSYNSIYVKFNAVTRASGYEVYRATTVKGSYKLISTTTKGSYNNTGLVTNTTYYYKVRAYRMVGNVKIYSYFLTTINAKPILSIPTKVKANRINSKSIKLTWSGATGASGYEVYKSNANNGVYSLLARTSGLYYTNSTLVTGRTYFYKVRSYRTVGKTKAYSNWTAVVNAKL